MYVLQEPVYDNSELTSTQSCATGDKIRECPRCRRAFMEMFKMPELWWSRWCKRSNGYFGCEDTTDEQGNFDGHSNSPLVRVCYSSADVFLDTWFRFLVKQTFEDAAATY